LPSRTGRAFAEPPSVTAHPVLGIWNLEVAERKIGRRHVILRTVIELPMSWGKYVNSKLARAQFRSEITATADSKSPVCTTFGVSEIRREQSRLVADDNDQVCYIL
jgi:hypothetical protein